MCRRLTFRPGSAKKEAGSCSTDTTGTQSVQHPDTGRCALFCLPGAKQPHIKKGGLHDAADKNTGCGLRTADVVFHGAGDGGRQRRAQARRDVQRGLPARAEGDRVHGRDRLCRLHALWQPRGAAHRAQTRPAGARQSAARDAGRVRLHGHGHVPVDEPDRNGAVHGHFSGPAG